MALTLKNNADANVTYNVLRDSSSGDKLDASYYGPLHSDTQKDILVVKSSDPKRTNDSYGVRRTTVGYYKSFAIAGPSTLTTSKDLKVELSVSFPVGIGSQVVSAAEFHEACARLQAFLSSETMTDNAALLGILPG